MANLWISRKRIDKATEQGRSDLSTSSWVRILFLNKTETTAVTIETHFRLARFCVAAQDPRKVRLLNLVDVGSLDKLGNLF